MSDTRLTELEIAVTHQAAALEELHAVAVDLGARIEHLERLVRALAARVAEDRTAPGAPPDPTARPPHW
jgi:uncharacterized coiled-coil protein SlyX